MAVILAVSCTAVVMHAPCLHKGQLVSSAQQTSVLGLRQRVCAPCANNNHKTNPQCQAITYRLQRKARTAVLARASSLDEGVSTSSSSLLGGSPTQTQNRSSNREPAGSVDGVELASEVSFHEITAKTAGKTYVSPCPKQGFLYCTG